MSSSPSSTIEALSRRLTLALALALALTVAGGAAAQDDDADAGLPPLDEPALEEKPKEDFFVDFLADGSVYVASDLDNGGQLELSSALAGFRLHNGEDKDVEWEALLGYRYDNYSFKGTLGFTPTGTKPWADIHTVIAGGSMRCRMDDTDWVFWGGGVFEGSGEWSADAGQSWIAGGFFAASYQVSPDLRVGGGVGVVSQIEDSAYIYPVVDIDWAITNELSLKTSSGVLAYTFQSIELAYQFDRHWNAGVALAYNRRRFRLTEGLPVSEGVGELSDVPMWARLSYMPDAHSEIYARVGWTFDGQISVSDSAGNNKSSTGWEGTWLIGVGASIRF